MIEEKTRTETKTRPPTRWRNRYLVRSEVWFLNGKVWPLGERWGDHTFPSYEVAEQKAHQVLQHKNCAGDRVLGDMVEWLGAYPDGERP